MSQTISVSAFNSVPVIRYRNKSINRDATWVCDGVWAARKALAKLRSMPHIEILEVCDSHVERESDDCTGSDTVDLEKMRVSFTRYGQTWKEGIKLADLIAEQQECWELFARAENSGSESIYVEVAKWCHKRQTWCRYCFEKMIDVFWEEAGFQSETEAAEAIAAWINNGEIGKSREKHEKVIGSLPTFGEDA